MASLIPPPAKMDMSGDLRANWTFFKLTWTNYAAATELNKKDAAVQIGTLLSVMGKDCLQVLNNMPMSNDERADPKKIIDKMTAYFEPKQNTIYERYVFNSCIQDQGEKFDHFLNRLRQLIRACDFQALQDEMLRDRIVIGICENNTRARLLRESELTLDKAIDICRSNEQATLQLQKLSNAESVHYAKSHKGGQPYRAHIIRDCKYCGKTHDQGKCEAFGQKCKACGKRNHLAAVCQSAKPKQVYRSGHKSQPQRKENRTKHMAKLRYVEADQLSSDESIYTVKHLQNNKQYFANIKVHVPEDGTQHTCRFQIDTGASCSTLALTDYKRLTSAPLQPSQTRLKLYDNSVIHPVGTVKLRCAANGITKKIIFEVVDSASPSLLSGRASAALKLVTFNEESVLQLNSTKTLTKDDVLNAYEDVFTGLGRLPGEYHIDIDENVKPVQNNPRRVPLALKAELKAKLDELVEQKVITWVTEPTPWINNIVVVRKPGKLRLCIDPFHLNKAIRRNHYPTPTVEEIATRMTKARMFSVADAQDGFLQVVLDEPSSYLTTCWTPFGRIRWLRMPFGISSAPEEWQRRLDQCLEGLDNIEVVVDDIIIYGSGDNDADAEKSHDTALIALLERCRQRGLKLNPSKLRFKRDSVNFIGHTFSAQGLAPDSGKVKAICEMPQPQDAQAVQRLLGMVNYLSKFTPKLSSVCEPLRRLLDKDAAFDWLPQHEEAFLHIKQLITEAPVLQYYDVDKDVTLECDSSEVGLGAVLTQNGHPVAFASRALTKTERNYAQIEKECLAIVFAAERFQQYILGKEKTKVLSDHKPLQAIFSKPIHTSPKRLQRMRLKLQKFSLDVEYKPGPQMFVSDTLSRASLPLPAEENDPTNYVIFALRDQQEFELVDMEENLYVTDQRLEHIRDETKHDASLITLMNVIKAGWPAGKNDTPLCVREYWPYRDELSTQNGLAFRGTRLIIPNSLRPQMIDRAHTSHLGIQYTLNTAREIMYWPRMHADITEAVQKCETCQEMQPAQQQEPLMSHVLPTYPWQCVASDCFEVNGQKFVVLVDVYSDFIDICQLQDMTSESLIRNLKPIFATHGAPAVLISDNGTNYVSSEFRKFTKSWDIQHITSSPHHHQSNGRAEAAVKLMKGIIKKSEKDGRDMWKAILEWRNATSPGMNNSPAQRLMSRRTRSMLPCNTNQYIPQVQENVQNTLIRKRQTAKGYYDRNSKPLPNLVVGQPVRVKTHPQTANSDWKSGIVTQQVAPRSYTVEVNGQIYRRNRIHLRDTVPGRTTTTGQHTVVPDPLTTAKSDQNKDTGQGDRTPPQTLRTSGRVTKPPTYLRDYVV